MKSRNRDEVGASLMRTALELETGIDAGRWTIEKRPSGQPVIAAGPHDASETKISLSHSGSLFAAAASSCDALGIDIETVRKRQFRKIAEYSKWPSSTWGNNAELPSSRFFQLWTLWEATIKANAGRIDSETHTLFTDLAELTSAGQPSSSGHDEWRVRSWHWTDEFWITVVARLHTAPRIHLYELQSLRAGDRNPDLRSVDGFSEFLNAPPRTAGFRAQR